MRLNSGVIIGIVVYWKIIINDYFNVFIIFYNIECIY